MFRRLILLVGSLLFIYIGVQIIWGLDDCSEPRSRLVMWTIYAICNGVGKIAAALISFVIAAYAAIWALEKS